jgi:hypothetical protein
LSQCRKHVGPRAHARISDMIGFAHSCMRRVVFELHRKMMMAAARHLVLAACSCPQAAGMKALEVIIRWRAACVLLITSLPLRCARASRVCPHKPHHAMIMCRYTGRAASAAHTAPRNTSACGSRAAQRSRIPHAGRCRKAVPVRWALLTDQMTQRVAGLQHGPWLP